MDEGENTDWVRGLFALHGQRLVLYARQWLDRAAAEDVVQEVFLRLMGRPVMPVAWVYRSVRNMCLTELRSAKRRGRRERAVERERAAWFEAATGERLDAERAAELMQQLPPEKREAVMLRIWGELGFADIAAVMGMPVSTVFHHYRTGLARLREQMEPKCHMNKT